MFDELVKLGAVSDEDARRSLDRLDQLEKSRPTGGQVARYGALGGAAGTVAGAIGNAIEHGSALKGSTPGEKFRNLAASGVKGAITGGAVPLVRAHLDQNAEKRTLKKYMNEKVGSVAWILAKLAASFMPPPASATASALGAGLHIPKPGSLFGPSGKGGGLVGDLAHAHVSAHVNPRVGLESMTPRAASVPPQALSVRPLPPSTPAGATGRPTSIPTAMPQSGVSPAMGHAATLPPPGQVQAFSHAPTQMPPSAQKVAMHPNEMLIAAFQDELEKIAGEGGLSRQTLEALMKQAGVMDALRGFYHGGTSAEGIPMTGLKHWLGNANPLQGAGSTLRDAGAVAGGKLRAAGSAVADKAQALKSRVSNLVSGGTSPEGIPMTGVKHWLGAANPLQGGMQTMREAPGLMQAHPVADAQQAAAGVARVRPRAPSRMAAQFDEGFGGMKAASAFAKALAKIAAPPVMSPSAALALQRTMKAGPAPASIGFKSLLGGQGPTRAVEGLGGGGRVFSALHKGAPQATITPSLAGASA